MVESEIRVKLCETEIRILEELSKASGLEPDDIIRVAIRHLYLKKDEFLKALGVA